jgi:hypothetical protein
VLFAEVAWAQVSWVLVRREFSSIIRAGVAMFYRLDALVLALSQHYRILKEVIKDNKGVTVYPSVMDARAADRLADMLADIGGEGFANYCRLKFRQAYTLGDIKIYDIRKILETVRDNIQDVKIKDRLSSKLELFVELAIRLSNPIACSRSTRYRRQNKKLEKKEEQLLLFPELAEKPEESKEVKEDENKQVKRRKKRVVRKQRVKRKTKIDKLADEIIDAEYGNDNNISDTDDLDDLDDTYKEEQEDDVYDYYSTGYSRIDKGDYDYFSGNYDNY